MQRCSRGALRISLRCVCTPSIGCVRPQLKSKPLPSLTSKQRRTKSARWLISYRWDAGRRSKSIEHATLPVRAKMDAAAVCLRAIGCVRPQLESKLRTWLA